MISKIKKNSAKFFSSPRKLLKKEKSKRKRGCTLKLDCIQRLECPALKQAPYLLNKSLGSFSLTLRGEVLAIVLLCSHVANKVDVVIKVPHKIFTNVLSSTAGISNKFSF